MFIVVTFGNTQSTQDLGYEWWLKVANSPVVRKATTIETEMSYPVGAASELRFFHYQVLDGQLQRPLTLVRAKLPELTEIEFKYDRDKTLYPGLPEELGEFVVEGWTLELEKSLLNLQPRIMERFPRQAAGALGEQYLELFDMLTPEALRPFYHALNPEYFDWLKT